MKMRLFIVLFLALMLHSCEEKPAAVRDNKIAKLSFATGGCFGECPFLAIEVDSTLDYKFYGGRYADLQGYYKGKISQALWDTINMKFEPLKNRNLETEIRSVDDMAIQSFIHFGQTVIKIEAQEMEQPKDVRDNFYWLMDSYKKIKLEKVADRISFETVIQYGPPVVDPPPLSEN